MTPVLGSTFGVRRAQVLGSGFLVLCLLCASPVSAHRLDEYLQASRLSLDPAGLVVEIDLTPGAAVASRILSLVDANGDGQWSAAEREAYAALVVRNALVEVDRRPARLALVESQFPTFDQMRDGLGTIRLRARGPALPTPSGGHEIRYFNIHEPEMSAYLINALVPPPGIEITAQRRDYWQHEITIDYRAAGSASAAWPIATSIALVAIVGTIDWRRRSLARRR